MQTFNDFPFKKYSCCISNCDTTGISKLFFNIPENFTTCPKWLSVLSRYEHVIHENALVCIRHFEKSDMLLQENGQVVAVDCQAMAGLFSTPSLDSWAVPSKRKNVVYYPDYMFYIIDRDAVPVSGNSKYLESIDFLKDLSSIQKECNKRLGSLITGWKINLHPDSIIFFYMHENMVKSTVKINKDLFVEITLSGRLMDPLDVTKWLPPSSRITRWSQLSLILRHFGMETQNNASTLLFDVNLNKISKKILLKI